MPIAKVTSKGQITIPVAVRKALKLKAGDEVDFFEIESGHYAFRPRTGSIQDLKGCVSKLGYVPTIEEINDAIGAAVAESYLRSVDGKVGQAIGASDDEAA